MKDKGTLAIKYKADMPKVAPVSVFDSPGPLISRAIAARKLKNRTKE